jgi:SAM-dependent methyltransferase
MTTAFAYDTVDYPSAALPQAHPGHLFAVARMFGLDAVPAERCRYIEVGCGDGTHLIACAIGLPHATFVGLDLSPAAVERGKQMIAELGLPNVSLYAADLTMWEPPAGGFDYVVAHGLYAWVPAPVRDGLLALMARCLPPTGVAYVSYNTYPGCYIRRMVWEMLKFHTASIAEPAAKIEQALELVKFLAAGRSTRDDAGMGLLGPELDGLLNKTHPHVLYHDDLGAVNDPVYFHEFVAHAGRHGLRFVAESEAHTMETRGFPEQIAGVLGGLAEKDVLLKEQYLDFLRLRRFRETLLSPDPRPPRATPDPAAVPDLAASGRPAAEPEPADLAPGVAVTFRSANKAALRTDLAAGKAALVELAAGWPKRLPFADLVARAGARLGRDVIADERGPLTELLAGAWMSGMIELNGHVPRYAETVSDRPVASPLARIQVRTGPLATTLLHATMRFDDAPSQMLVRLLDGTRTREQIAKDVVAAFPPDKRPDPAALKAGLDRNLERLAKAGLLVG